MARWFCTRSNSLSGCCDMQYIFTMNADINVPQSKSITIVFTVMRLSFLLFNA